VARKPSAEFEKSYERHRKKIVELVRTVHINANRIEQLKLALYDLNRKTDDARRPAAQAGRRLPHPAPRDFLDNYLTHEIDPTWLDKVGKLSGPGAGRTSPKKKG